MRARCSIPVLLVLPTYKENMQAKFHVGARRPDALGFRSCPSAKRNISRHAFIEHKSPGMPIHTPKAASSEGPRYPCPSATSGLVTLKFEDLIAGKDLSREIEKAYGPDGLGALLVSGVPDLLGLRQELLQLADKFASLPDHVKARYEDPLSHYSVGWSLGRESLENGLPDTNKGSYYANPLADDLLDPKPHDVLRPWEHPLVPLSHSHASQDLRALGSGSSSGSGDAAGLTASELLALREQYPGYYRPNVWPREELPRLEPAFKELGRLVCAVGCRLAQHCDRYVSSKLGVQEGQLAARLHHSHNPKARLLHYYAQPAEGSPQQGHQQQQQQQQGARGEGAAASGADEHSQAWCGWHSDHGSLTGLTSALYLDAHGREVPNPDPSAGLYIRTRHGQVVQAAIPRDCLAYQVGEALQVHSGGLLQATPHYVRAASGPAAAGISRNTFAVFMQPNVHEPMVAPRGVDTRQVGVGQWRPGSTFGEFAEMRFRKYYEQANGSSPGKH